MALPFQTNANPNIYAQPTGPDPEAERLRQEEELRQMMIASRMGGRALPQALGQPQAADPTGMVTNATTAPPVRSGGLPRATGRSPASGGMGTDEFNMAQLAKMGDLQRQAYAAMTPSEADMDKGRGESMSGQLAGMALSAMGGEGLAPAGGAVLKQALAQQEKFGIDPYRDAKLRAERLAGDASLREKVLGLSTAKQLRQEALQQAQMNRDAMYGLQSQRNSILAAKDPKTSEGEKSSAGYLGRMLAAEKLLESNAGGKPSLVTALAGNAPTLRPYIESVDQQKYRQAQEDWVRAKLRKESGAVIGKDEMDAEIRTYFPQPGESDPALITQKAQSRLQAIEQMRTGAGHATSTEAPKAQGSVTEVRRVPLKNGRIGIEYSDGSRGFAQ